MRRLRVDRLVLGQHLYVLSDLPGPRLSALDAADPVDDGVPVGAADRVEERCCGRIGVQGLAKVVGYRARALTLIGSVPAPIGSCGIYLTLPRWPHAACGNEGLGLRRVDLRPAAA